jgi:hypothetical protein
LIHGDFSRLHPEVQRLINELSGKDQLRRLSDLSGIPLKIVAIALLANFASDEDPRAGRIWSAIFNRFREALQNGMRRDFIEPLEFFFRETDDRLRHLVAELAHVRDRNSGRFDRNPTELVLEIGSKTKSRMHELMDEANDRLMSLVQHRIASVQKEFLLVSRTFQDL